MLRCCDVSLCCAGRNMNNFQTQTQDWLYVDSASGLMFDTNGVQLIRNTPGEYGPIVSTVTINAVKLRGSPVYGVQEVGQINTGNELHLVVGSKSPAPTCPLPKSDVAWNFVELVEAYFSADSRPFQTVCSGLAMVQSYGDNRIGDFVYDDEGHKLAG